MSILPNESAAFIATVLRQFPLSVSGSIISDPIFCNRYEISTDAKLTLGISGVTFQRSILYNGIRTILADKGKRQTLKDIADEDWCIELNGNDSERRFTLYQGNRRFILPELSALSSNKQERLNGFDQEADRVDLPEHIRIKWRNALSHSILSDDEFDALNREIENTPVKIATTIISEIYKGTSTLTSLVPCSEQYFERLVGRCQSISISEYVLTGATDHIHQLMSWRSYDGFLLSLLLSSHSSISYSVCVDLIKEEELVQSYKWLQERGDRISQIGAVEIGISVLDRMPGIEPYIYNIIQQIRDDNPDDDNSRFKLLSSLIVLVDGELSRTKVLRNWPPFLRRLASIAQASLIERGFIESQVDISEFAKWAMHEKGQPFYLQTMTDLRREPRWYPDFISPQQLKAEFIGRIFSALEKNVSKITTSVLHEFILEEGLNSLRPIIEFPFPYLPGPLEGGLESPNELPKEIMEKIQEQLKTDVLELNSFLGLVNSTLIFNLDSRFPQLAAKAIQIAKYQISHIDSNEILFSILRGLSTVAAVTRNKELSKELMILTRRYRNEPSHNLSAEEAMFIGLIAAAAHSELIEWCEFFGEWVTDIAFQSLQQDEIERLHSHLEILCHIEHGLWRTCGRARAALNALLESEQ